MLFALVIEVSLVVEELPLTIVEVLVFEVPLPVGPSMVMIARVSLTMVGISHVVEAIGIISERLEISSKVPIRPVWF